MAREVSLPDILDAREQRAGRQRYLLEKYASPIISFSMNIPGPVKDTALIRRAFAWGAGELEKSLKKAEIPVAERLEVRAFTGCEQQLALRADPGTIKTLCVAIEESCPMGRLFDMDVIAPDGRKLDRGEERRCLVCGQRGRGCASRRVHSVPELQAAARALMEEHFAALDRDTVVRLADQALRREVDTTPKPGLVDGRNTGSHRDMTRDTFYQSADALRSYWGRCFDLGRESAGRPPEESFPLLREAGLRADAAMLSATNGRNTHKGVIFTLGTVCGAVGRLWRPETPCRDIPAICAEAGAMYAPTLARDQAAFTGATAGERLYLKTGNAGVRGELAAGLPGVTDIALPAMEAALSAGCDENTAAVASLLALIGRGTDTNMIHRGGEDAAREASADAAALLRSGPVPDLAAVEALDDAFIRRNLSPGGCADLLAVSLFLRAWQHGE